MYKHLHYFLQSSFAAWKELCRRVIIQENMNSPASLPHPPIQGLIQSVVIWCMWRLLHFQGVPLASKWTGKALACGELFFVHWEIAELSVGALFLNMYQLKLGDFVPWRQNTKKFPCCLWFISSSFKKNTIFFWYERLAEKSVSKSHERKYPVTVRGKKQHTLKIQKTHLMNFHHNVSCRARLIGPALTWVLTSTASLILPLAQTNLYTGQKACLPNHREAHFGPGTLTDVWHRLLCLTMWLLKVIGQYLKKICKQQKANGGCRHLDIRNKHQPLSASWDFFPWWKDPLYFRWPSHLLKD